MRKDALEVGKDYALWTGHGSYDAAKREQRWYSNHYTHITGTKRIRIVALDKRADVPAGPHTTSTVSVPVVTIQRLNANGEPDGKQTYLRDAKKILTTWREWSKDTATDRKAMAKKEAESQAKAERQKQIGERVAAALGLKPDLVRVSISKYDGEKPTFSVRIEEQPMTAPLARKAA